MFVVGLTGGIGSGKSTVADLFAAHGVPLVDTDVIAHRITAPHGIAMPQIAAEFGDSFVAADGSLDRVPIMLERAWREEVSEATEQPLENDGLPTRYNLWVPRSACPHCGHVLNAWENLPVLSYLLLRGRCSACKTRISLRYPLLEIATAAFAAGALALYGPTGTALAAFGLCAALLAMSAIDIDTHLLPDSMTLPLLWAGLIVNFNGVFASLHDAVLGAIFGYLVLWAVHWLFRLVRGIEGMGYGDF